MKSAASPTHFIPNQTSYQQQKERTNKNQSNKRTINYTRTISFAQMLISRHSEFNVSQLDYRARARAIVVVVIRAQLLPHTHTHTMHTPRLPFNPFNQNRLKVRYPNNPNPNKKKTQINSLNYYSEKAAKLLCLHSFLSLYLSLFLPLCLFSILSLKFSWFLTQNSISIYHTCYIYISICV